jgi:helicase
MQELERKMEKMLYLLEGWKFIHFSQTEKNVHLKNSKNSFGFTVATEIQKSASATQIFESTLLGKRISELYLDPLTARHLLDCLLHFTASKNNFSLLQMVSHTLEMRPLLRTKKREEEKIQEEISKRYALLLEEEPSPFHIEYGEFVDSVKTALFFEAWTQEKDEEYLLETFDVRPGEIKVKLDAADWLLYASDELAKLLELRDVRKYLAQLRLQIQYGVKEELLPLIRLKGIGRVRARKLFVQGIFNLGQIKNSDITSLSQILGSKVLAEEVKKQVGEEIKEVPAGKRVGQLSIEGFQ